MSILIIGSGFFGRAMSAFLRAKGEDTQILDSFEEGASSRAASGYYNPRWYKDRPAIEKAAEIAQALGLSLTPAHARYLMLSGEEKPEAPDLYLIRRDEYLGLGGEIVAERVTRLRKESDAWDVYTEGGRVYAAPAVYLAAGVWTDELLQASGLPRLGVSRLGGAGLLYDTPLPARMTWAMVAPYRAIAVRPWTDTRARVCATTETPKSSVSARETLRRKGEPFLPEGSKLVGVEFGYRPKLAGGPAALRVAPRLYVGTGGGKIGAIWAFHAAARVFEMMQEDGVFSEARRGIRVLTAEAPVLKMEEFLGALDDDG